MGPTIASGYELAGAAADFNGDGKPDYVLYNPSTRQTAIWYLNNNVHIASALGPTLPAGWSLVAPGAAVSHPTKVPSPLVVSGARTESPACATGFSPKSQCN